MASSFGEALKVHVFGASHAESVGCIVEGLPAGTRIDSGRMASAMARRAPGSAAWTTPRKEADEVEIVSGVDADGMSYGAPIVLEIANTNVRSSDYEKLARVPRPGHADWTARMRFGDEIDLRGGGMFSGRLTAPIVAAGSIASAILEDRGVRIAAHLLAVGDIRDEAFCAREMDDAAQTRLAAQMDALASAEGLPAIDEAAAQAMTEAIAAASREGDSVGAVVECVCTGLPAGIGDPIYDGIESMLARISFGIGAVKGVEFGAGFEAARMRGSEHNDPYCIRDGAVALAKNDCGGNLGGITTGSPLLMRWAVKPTSSISKPQASVDLATLEETVLKVEGRHDPCIGPRAVPVAEAVMALAVLDAWLSYPPHQM